MSVSYTHLDVYKRQTYSFVHVSTHAPVVSPAPKALMASLSPACRRPARLTSSSKMGTLAEEVLPRTSTFMGNFSIGCLRRTRAASMMRLLA